MMVRDSGVLGILLFVGAQALAQSPSPDTWGEIRYTHREAKLYYAPVSAAASVLTLGPNESVKAVASGGGWCMIFRPSETEDSRTNVVGYMRAFYLHAEPLTGGTSLPVGTAVEALAPIPRPASRSFSGRVDGTPAPEKVPDNPVAAHIAANPPKEPSVHREGEAFIVGYTGYRVRRSWWTERLTIGDEVKHPNEAYLCVDLSLANADQQPRSVPSMHLVAAGGGQHNVNAITLLVEDALPLDGDLDPGATREGMIVFDVGRAQGYKLMLSGGAWSSDSAIVNLTPR